MKQNELITPLRVTIFCAVVFLVAIAYASIKFEIDKYNSSKTTTTTTITTELAP